MYSRTGAKINLSRFLLFWCFLVAIALPATGWTETDRPVLQEVMQKARQLMQQRDYEEAIALLDPVFGSSFQSASYFHRAHLALRKRLQFIKRSRVEADKGNPFVSYFLASELLDSALIDEPREIERYLLNASRFGIAQASEELGHIYFYGLEPNPLVSSKPRVLSDLSKAKEMFESCSTDDSVGLGCTVGLGHTLLELKPSAPNEAIAQFERAKAYGTLWGMYFFGIGVPKDTAKAQDYLSRIKNDSTDELSSCNWEIRRSADGLAKEDPQSLAEIAFKFGVWSRRAKCLPGGPKHHIGLLERAVAGGSSYAAQYLAAYYYFGTLVRKDPVLAFYYSSILGMTGDVKQRQEAADHLERLEQVMSQADLSEARSMFRKWKEVNRKQQ